MKIVGKVISVLLIGAACSIATLYLAKQSNEQVTIPIKTTIKAPTIVDKKLVIEKLATAAEIVGPQIDFNKSGTYADKTFFGSRQFTLTIHGNIKMGFKVSDLIKGIRIDGTTIKVATPKLIMVSFEAPFENATIESKVGLLRKDFNAYDLQEFNRDLSDKAKAEILNDQITLQKATDDTEDVVRSLLSTVPNVTNVEFAS